MTLDPQPGVPVFLEHPADLVGHRVDLTLAGTGGHDEVIDDGRDAGQVEHDNITTAVVVGDPRSLTGLPVPGRSVRGVRAFHRSAGHVGGHGPT